MAIVNPRAPDSPPIPSSYLYPYPCVLQSKKIIKKKEVMSLRDGWVVWWMDGCGEEWIDGQRTYIIYKEGSYFMYSCRISQHKQFYSLGWFPLFRTDGWGGGEDLCDVVAGCMDCRMREWLHRSTTFYLKSRYLYYNGRQSFFPRRVDLQNFAQTINKLVDVVGWDGWREGQMSRLYSL